MLFIVLEETIRATFSNDIIPGRPLGYSHIDLSLLQKGIYFVVLREEIVYLDAFE